MKLTAMRCTKKIKQNGGIDVTLHFHSADLESMAIIVCRPEDGEEFKVGLYYDFEANSQKSRILEN